MKEWIVLGAGAGRRLGVDEAGRARLCSCPARAGVEQTCYVSLKLSDVALEIMVTYGHMGRGYVTHDLLAGVDEVDAHQIERELVAWSSTPTIEVVRPHRSSAAAKEIRAGAMPSRDRTSACPSLLLAGASGRLLTQTRPC